MTGNNVSAFNGIYLPVDEKESKGRPIYKKEGRDVYIEYHAATGKWHVKEKAKADRGSNTRSMTSVDECEEAGGVEEVRCGWEVYNATSQAFEQQAGAVVVRKASVVRVFGTGSSVSTLNGIPCQWMGRRVGAGRCTRRRERR